MSWKAKSATCTCLCSHVRHSAREVPLIYTMMLGRVTWASTRMLGTWPTTTPPTFSFSKAYQALARLCVNTPACSPYLRSFTLHAHDVLVMVVYCTAASAHRRHGDCSLYINFCILWLVGCEVIMLACVGPRYTILYTLFVDIIGPKPLSHHTAHVYNALRSSRRLWTDATLSVTLPYQQHANSVQYTQIQALPADGIPEGGVALQDQHRSKHLPLHDVALPGHILQQRCLHDGPLSSSPGQQLCACRANASGDLIALLMYHGQLPSWFLEGSALPEYMMLINLLWRHLPPMPYKCLLC